MELLRRLPIVRYRQELLHSLRHHCSEETEVGETDDEVDMDFLLPSIIFFVRSLRHMFFLLSSSPILLLPLPQPPPATATATAIIVVILFLVPGPGLDPSHLAHLERSSSNTHTHIVARTHSHSHIYAFVLFVVD